MTPEEIAILETKLADPLWRLTSGELYKIKTADGQGIIPFLPRAEQVELLRKLMHAKAGTGPRQMVEVKSRRLGYSTTIGVFVADCIMFSKGFTGTLIDQTQFDASKKLNGIVKVALESAAVLLSGIGPVTEKKSNDSTVSIDWGGTGVSEFFAGTKSRGGSNDLLWVSEWGPIQFEDVSRSAEIRSGALPSARHGITVVETTWKGGKGGDLWELIEPTINGAGGDWQLNFTPWWTDPRNVSDDSQIDDKARAYFAKIQPRLDALGVVLTDQQRRWWAKERRAQGIFMARENPTFLDECWSAPVEGAIYAECIGRAQAEGRICSMPVDGSNLVNTSWDLGSPANTVIWYWQIVGREIRVIDCDIGQHGTLTERVAAMNAKGYSFGKHYLPHDAQQTERTRETMSSALIKAGLPAQSLVCVPRCHSVWVGINHALELFSALSFNEPKCRDGLAALSSYHVKKTNSGVAEDPIHDWSSHASDAFRYMAEAHMHGLVSFKYTTAPVGAYSERRRKGGMKPMRVSA